MKGDALAKSDQAKQNDKELGENQDKKTGNVFFQEIMTMRAEVEQAAEPEDRINLCIELQQGFVLPAFAPGNDAAEDVGAGSVAAHSHDDCRRKVCKGKHEQQH